MYRAAAACLALLLIACLGCSTVMRIDDQAMEPSEAASDRLEIVVDEKAVACHRFLGFGAEWDPRGYDYQPGAPDPHWDLVVKRLTWMKIPIVRMMMLTRWCCPTQAGLYKWQNKQMKTLCRHLDLCQKLGTTVILTDWGCATWTKAPGLSGINDPKYARTIGMYMDYLLNIRDYSCIKYFVLVNEPNFEGGGWDNWKTGVENVAKTFAGRGIDKRVIFTGSDESNDEGWHRRAVDELSHIFGAWYVHRYESNRHVQPGKLEPFFRRHWDYVRANDPHAEAKPFIVGEAGLNDGANHPIGNKHINRYKYGLFMADYAVQAARAGSNAVIAWMLDDTSHDNFYWGLWDRPANGSTLRPWFYPWSLLCRYFRPNSTIFRINQPIDRLRILAARTAPDTNGNTDWTFCIVNRNTDPVNLKLTVPAVGKEKLQLKHYLYSQQSAPADPDGFPIPISAISSNLAKGISLTCPPQAVIFLTSLD
jgi:hypothetical protein